MASITVCVGCEDKEISGLTRKTTCLDVLEALLKDKQAAGTTTTGEDHQHDDLDISDTTDIRDFVQSYVVVENWRGCEKPLPPKTRILAVWQAWGKEQCHVKFTLKKDKNIDFRVSTHEREESSTNHYNNLISMMSHNQHQLQTDSSQFLHKLSHGQKKRIRRSIMQFQRAVLIQHKRENVDDNNNSGKQSRRSTERTVNSVGDRASSSRQKTTETSSMTLSEEQFVDGVVTGPDCFLRHEGKSKFIRTALDNKDFNREHCTYRRPHHRRRSLMFDDSDGLSDQNVVLPTRHTHEIHHYPYCQTSKRRSNSRQRRHHSRKRHGRVSKHSRRHGRHSSPYSTGSTTTSTGTPSTVSEIDCDSHSEGEDADDEKSIMAEFGLSISRQKIGQYPKSLRPCVNRYGSVATSGSIANATDSSSGTTTCSETSNASSFSGTSSSETSSSADIYNESFFAKRAAAAAATAAAKAATNEKSKAARLFRKVTGPSLSKPAQSFLGSFKKKRKAPQTQASQSKTTSTMKTTDASRDNKTLSKNNAKLVAKLPRTNEKPIAPEKMAAQEQNKPSVSVTLPSTMTSAHKLSGDGVSAEECQSSSQTEPCKITKLTEDSNTQKTIEQFTQVVLSQEQILQSANQKAKSTDAEIERIESQVHRWRTQTHGKNYVQDIYLAGSGDLAPGQNEVLPSQQAHKLSWVNECQDPTRLCEYLDSCERVVDTQMRIEECKRHAEILLQDMRDEVWKASSNPNTAPQSNRLTAAALGLVTTDGGGADSSDDEEDSNAVSLSVTTGNSKTSGAPSTDISSNNKDSAEGTLEIERSRTELEANLYLSLRLSTELQEVDQLVHSSQRLLQSKGETLLNLVREIAQSSEGISPQLWGDYGELLVAYDTEVSLQEYLASCAVMDNANRTKPESQITQIENFKSAGTFDHDIEGVDPKSPSTTALHHALSPWLWCEHCKHELEQQQQGRLACTDVAPMSSHWIRHNAIPASFSELPLPSPSVAKEPLSTSVVKSMTSMTPLLPMPPIPDCNDSDYDEIPDKLKGVAFRKDTSAIISAEDAIPTGISFRHLPALRQDQESPVPNSKQIQDLLSSTSNHSASNTDDSGNASAASTTSFGSTNSDGASTDAGSRNGSCDGGSPRPVSIEVERQDSAQSSSFLVRNNAKRGSGRTRFFFPSQLKLTQDDTAKISSKGLRSPPRANQTKDRSCVPLKSSVSVNPGTIASTPASPADQKRLSSSQVFDNDRLEQQKKLIRRNSTRNRKTTPVVPQAFGKRASSFGKGGLRLGALPSDIRSIVKQPIVHNSHCDLANNKLDKSFNSTNLKNKYLKNCPLPLDFLPKTNVFPQSFHSPASTPSSPFVGNSAAKVNCRDLRRQNIPPLINDIKKSSLIPSNYDNDSDTGLSSLHSTDSVDKLNMYSETLV